MGKYSSDSENERLSSKRSYKSSNRKRSLSSSSSDSGSRSRRRYKQKQRSRSRDRYSKSRRSNSRSNSKYKSKYSHKSSDRKAKDHKHISYSKDKHRSRRSRSKSYIKEYESKPKRQSSTSSSSSDSSDMKDRSSSSADSKSKVRGKPKIAASTFKLSDDPIEVDVKLVEEINKDDFNAKEFISSSKTKNLPNKILIDLKKQTIKVPEVAEVKVEPDSIFYHNLFQNEEVRMEKWIKDLYNYRQKSLLHGIKK